MTFSEVPGACRLKVECEGTPGRGGSALTPGPAAFRIGNGHPRLALLASISAAQTAKDVAPKPKSSGDKPLHDVVAGALARAISQATIHPIDTLKVRMQAGAKAATSGGSAAATGAAAAAQPAVPSGSAAAAASSHPQLPLRLAAPGSAVAGAVKELKSLYKGVAGAAGGAGIIIGAFFAFYSTSKQLLRERTDLPEGTVAFIAGAIAAVGSSVVKVPIAVCIRSVQAGVYPNALAAARSVVQKAGTRGLFTGFLPTLLEDVPDMAVKFAVYETLRAVHMRLHKDERPSTLEDLVMGGIAGSAAAAATTPLDVVKTRMMCTASSRPTVLGAVRGILAEAAAAGGTGGPAATLRLFFRGVGPRALSNGLNSAIFYMWFELLRSHIQKVLATQQQQQHKHIEAATRPAPEQLLRSHRQEDLRPAAASSPGLAAGAAGGSVDGEMAAAGSAPRPPPSQAAVACVSMSLLGPGPLLVQPRPATACDGGPEGQRQQDSAGGYGSQGAGVCTGAEAVVASCSTSSSSRCAGCSEGQDGSASYEEASRAGSDGEQGAWGQTQGRRWAVPCAAAAGAGAGWGSWAGVRGAAACSAGRMECLSLALPVDTWELEVPGGQGQRGLLRRGHLWS